MVIFHGVDQIMLFYTNANEVLRDSVPNREYRNVISDAISNNICETLKLKKHLYAKAKKKSSLWSLKEYK